MARLPVVDGDNNTWGTILNDFLEVSLNNDGTLSPQAVSAAGAYSKPTGGIPNTDLSNSVQANLASASSAIQSVNDKTGTDITLVASDVSAIPTSQRGADNGVASLDGTGNLPADELGNATFNGRPLPANAESGDYSAFYDAIGTASLIRRRTVPKLPWTPSVNPDTPLFSTFGPGGTSPINDYGQKTAATVLPFNTEDVTYLGCLPVVVEELSTQYIQNQCNGSSGSGCTPWAIEFDYYGQDFDIRFRTAVSGSGSQPWFWVWVDGQPVTSEPQQCNYANTSANSLSYYRVTWQAKKQRRIRIYFSAADFGGMDICPNDTVSASGKSGLSVAVIGDSWAAGTGATCALQGFATTLGIMLGVETYLCSYGGTGYTATDTGIFYVYGASQRIDPLATILPTWVIVEGSENDNSASASAVQAAATACYEAIAAATPASLLGVVSVQNVNGSVPSQAALNDAAIATAALAAGAFVIARPINENWFTGTGNNSGTLVTPPALTLGSATSGGSFVAGTYFWVVTAVTDAGETIVSNEVSATLTAGQEQLLTWTAVSGAGYRIYRGTSSGDENVLVTYQGASTSYTDTGTSKGPDYPANPGISTGATGDGNADYFSNGLVVAHPTQVGHDYFARRIYEDIIPTLLP